MQEPESTEGQSGVQEVTQVEKGDNEEEEDDPVIIVESDEVNCSFHHISKIETDQI